MIEQHGYAIVMVGKRFYRNSQNINQIDKWIPSTPNTDIFCASGIGELALTLTQKRQTKRTNKIIVYILMSEPIEVLQQGLEG